MIEAWLRGERRLGEMLNDLPRNVTGRPTKKSSDDQKTFHSILEELEISHAHAYRTLDLARPAGSAGDELIAS